MAERPAGMGRKWLAAGLIAAGIFAAARWLLPLLWPFPLAWAAAAALEPVVARLCRHGLRRGAAAGLCTLGLLAVAVGLLALLGGRLWGEISELAPRLPGLLSAAADTVMNWERRLDGVLARLPEGAPRAAADALAEAAAQSLRRLPGEATGRLIAALPDLAAAAPELLLSGVTAVLGTYFFSASYPELLHRLARPLPDRFLYQARLLRCSLRRTVGRYLRAQGLLCLIVCGALSAAFLLLRVRYALLLALFTAVVDALPVLGAGAVLLPWALFALLGGDAPLGAGLAVTWGAVSLLRSSLQAKLLGDQLGLHPLVSLLAIYAGWRLWGVWGMLLFPIGAILLKQTLPGLAPIADYKNGG